MNYVVYSVLVTNSTGIPVVIKYGGERHMLHPRQTQAFTNVGFLPASVHYAALRDAGGGE